MAFWITLSLCMVGLLLIPGYSMLTTSNNPFRPVGSWRPPLLSCMSMLVLVYDINRTLPNNQDWPIPPVHTEWRHHSDHSDHSDHSVYSDHSDISHHSQPISHLSYIICRWPIKWYGLPSCFILWSPAVCATVYKALLMVVRLTVITTTAQETHGKLAGH